MHPGAAFEHRENHRETRAVDVGGQALRRSVDGLADERLQLDEHGTRADDARDHARTARPRGGAAATEKEL